jgi:hypothetical protein
MGLTSCSATKLYHTVNGGDFKAAPGQFYGVPARPAAKIEHAAASALGQGKNAGDFVRRGGKPFVGKHEWVKIPPEVVIFKPFHNIQELCIVTEGWLHACRKWFQLSAR